MDTACIRLLVCSESNVRLNRGVSRRGTISAYSDPVNTDTTNVLTRYRYEEKNECDTVEKISTAPNTAQTDREKRTRTTKLCNS